MVAWGDAALETQMFDVVLLVLLWFVVGLERDWVGDSCGKKDE